MQIPENFTPEFSNCPAHRGSISTSFSVESTEVVQDMANAVETEMQWQAVKGNILVSVLD